MDNNNTKKFNKVKIHHIKIIFTVLSIVSSGLLAMIVYSISTINKIEEQLIDVQRDYDVVIQSAANLMQGSDFLTAQVWRFVATGQREYMDSYWYEVNVVKSRDASLDTLTQGKHLSELVEQLTIAKAESDALVGLELWGMRMICDANGMPVSEMPKEVAEYIVPEIDKQLPNDLKKELAIKWLFGEKYKESKGRIIDAVKQCRLIEQNIFNDTMTLMKKRIDTYSNIIRFSSISLFVLLVSSVIFYFNMIIKKVRKLRSDFLHGHRIHLGNESDDVSESLSFYYELLEQIYLRDEQISNLARLDELTKLPSKPMANELMAEAMNNYVNTLGLILIEFENFEKFNFEHGVSIGDRLLIEVGKRFSQTVTEGEGFVARVGDKKFLAVVYNVDEKKLNKFRELLISKINSITSESIGLRGSDLKIELNSGLTYWTSSGYSNVTDLVRELDRSLYKG